MTDISLCTNKTCTQRDECYRSRAKPSLRQAYSGFEQVNGTCEYFIPIESYHVVEKIKEIQIDMFAD